MNINRRSFLNSIFFSLLSSKIYFQYLLLSGDLKKVTNSFYLYKGWLLSSDDLLLGLTDD